MADDKNFETTTKSTSARKRSSGSRASSVSEVSQLQQSDELDLERPEHLSEGEGFNHPHMATDLSAITELNTTPEVAPAVTSRLGNLSREDFMNSVKVKAQEYSGRARETAETVRRQAGEFAKRFEDVPAKSREVLSRVDSTTRANPWLSMAVTGAGALALGFLAGRLFTRASEAVGEAGYAFDQAIDE